MTSNLTLLQKIQEDKNPWTINSLAEVAGAYMFHDQEYINRTRIFISSERKRIYEELKTWKHVKVYEPHANFILVRILKEDVTSYDVFVHCIKRGLMLRDCSTFPGLEDETLLPLLLYDAGKKYRTSRMSTGNSGVTEQRRAGSLDVFPSGTGSSFILHLQSKIHIP